MTWILARVFAYLPSFHFQILELIYWTVLIFYFDLFWIAWHWKPAISHSFAALTREILFLPLEHKIVIFSPPCNILYILIRQLSSSIASFVWKPAHFELRSYGGAWHNTKIAFVEKYTLISWFLAILGTVLSNFQLSGFGREKNEIPQTFPDERSR